MTSGLKKNFMGKRIVLNLFKKHGYTVSPGVNKRAAAIGDCARKAGNMEDRKDCFRGNKVAGAGPGQKNYGK